MFPGDEELLYLRETFEKWWRAENGVSQEHSRPQLDFEPEDFADLVYDYIHGGEMFMAQECINAAFALYPDADELWALQTKLCLRDERMADAEEAYSHISNSLNSIERIMILGEMYVAKGDIEQAEKAFACLPGEAEDEYELNLLYTDTAEVYVFYQYWEEAYSHIRKAKKSLIPEQDRLPFMRLKSNIYYEVGKYDKAVVLSKEISEADAFDGANWVLLGQCYLELGKMAEAEEALNFALAIDEKDLEGLNALAFVQSATGRIKEAISTLKTALKISPDSPGLILSLVENEMRHDSSAENSERLIKLLETAEEYISPTDELFFDDLMSLKKKAYVFAGREKDFNEQHDYTGVNAPFQYISQLTRARAHLENGEYNKAMWLFKEIYDTSEANPYVSISIASILVTSDYLDEALHYAGIAYQNKITRDNALPIMALCYKMLGRRELYLPMLKEMTEREFETLDLFGSFYPGVDKSKFYEAELQQSDDESTH